ncbi:MAG TPA: DinB family protein [Sphingobacteriaceae bacterium]
MEIIPMLLKEMEQEAQTTRKMLERVPNDKYGWKPHEKSMTIKQLATHIAELPSWVTMALTTNELDFASNPYQPVDIKSTEELLGYFERSLADGKTHLEKATEDLLNENWILREGETIYSTSSKGEVIRMAFSQIVHHRAQLGVYLRLLNIPIPGSYGPSADEGF